MWFKPKPFHQTPSWTKLARKHKAIQKKAGKWKCTDCTYAGWDLQSDHVLPVKKFKLSRLWLSNLELRCGTEDGNSCHNKKGVHIILTPKTAKLLFLYGFIWTTRWTVVLSIVTLLFVHRSDVFDVYQAVVDSPQFHSLTDFLMLQVEGLDWGLIQPVEGQTAFSQSSYSDHDIVCPSAEYPSLCD